MKLSVMFVTKDEDKFQEMKELLHSKVNLIHFKMNIHDYQGPVEHVIERRCREARALTTDYPVLVEENMLCCNALGGLPGTLTNCVYEKIGVHGIINLLQAWEDKSAYVICAIGFLEKEDSEIKIFKSEELGTIVTPQEPVESGRRWESCFLSSFHDPQVKKRSRNKTLYRDEMLDEIKAFFGVTNA